LLCLVVVAEHFGHRFDGRALDQVARQPRVPRLFYPALAVSGLPGGECGLVGAHFHLVAGSGCGVEAIYGLGAGGDHRRLEDAWITDDGAPEARLFGPGGVEGFGL